MDVYQIVTEKIISMLERGAVPWRKSWSAGSGMPRNLVSKKEYRGINTLLLGCQAYGSPYWLTYRQATEHFNGHVRKGEKSSVCVFWKMLDNNSDDDSSSCKSKIPMLRYYNVFNLEQCEGVTAPPVPEETVNRFTANERAEQILAGYGDCPEIIYGGNVASYTPVSDRVRMPCQHTFDSGEAFFNVLYHELSHSTGHKSRLARKEVIERNEFGSADYSSEELCAELSASFLCAHAGISNETLEQSASYINGWLSVLKQDKRMITVAAARAQASADYILGRKFGEGESE